MSAWRLATLCNVFTISRRTSATARNTPPIPPSTSVRTRSPNHHTATNRELMEEVRAGRFREDLYYRLNVVHIAVPPLRDRLEDIPPLVDYYLKKLTAEKRRPPMTLSDEGMRFLKRRNWPGNVRELINALEYAVVTAEESIIQPHDFPYGDDDAN